MLHFAAEPPCEMELRIQVIDGLAHIVGIPIDFPVVLPPDQVLLLIGTVREIHFE